MKTLILVATFFALIHAAAAGQISKADFSDVNDLSLIGSAAQVANELRLTDLTAQELGSVWHTRAQPVIGGFEVSFDFRIVAGGAAPAEGLAFVIQNSMDGSLAVGAPGPEIGYGTLRHSLAIEIDTSMDAALMDQSANELSVHTGGMWPNGADENFSLGRIQIPFSVTDGAAHTLRAVYAPGLLEVFIDNLAVPLLSIPYDFDTGGTYLHGFVAGGLSLEDGRAWVGFTGTTGATSTAVQAAVISNWFMTSMSGLGSSFDGNVNASSGAAVDLLSVNSSTGDFFRRVRTDTFLPFSIQLAQPPANSAPADFVVFGEVGAVDGHSPYASAFGDFCLHPDLVFHWPTTFTLANTFILPTTSLLPATHTPWNVIVPGGIRFPTTFTLQAGVEDRSAPSGFAVSNGVIVEVRTAPAPSISEISPASAPAGSPITISGQGFNPNLSLTIDGMPVVPSSVSPISIVFPFPAGGLSCDVNLTILNPDGQSTTQIFNVSPVISTAPNPQGPAAGGQTFLIGGSGYSDLLDVTFGSTPASFTLINSALMIIDVPPGVPGLVTVTLSSPGGCTATTTYTYL